VLITDSSSRLDMVSNWLEVRQIRLSLAANIAGKKERSKGFFLTTFNYSV
jgi:hypothetical protein